MSSRSNFVRLTTFVLAMSCGCVLDTDHVSTKLQRICSADVTLLFSADGDGMVASTPLEGVGRSVDDEAHASLDTLIIDPIDGVDDLAFTQSVTIEVVAPGSELPDLRVAESAALGTTAPAVVTGDPSANMAGYLAAEELLLRSRLLGTAPVEVFTARVQACLDVDGIEVEDP